VGDAVRLRAALENLIDNAVKFTETGMVGLAVNAQQEGRGRVRLHFAVTDSGIGLTPAEIKRLFRPFAQASDAVAARYGGAGLGLVAVKSVAKAMGGDLAVASKPGAGSRFTLNVAVTHVESAAAADVPLPAMRRLAILCAEDSPYGRIVMNTILAELGHRVDFVGSGDTAVEAVTRGGYDLVLMDLALPQTDGLTATQRIRGLAGENGRVPVIGVSGRDDSHTAQLARGAGMNALLAKPITPRTLAVAIAKAMAG
jgi:CheY-like chemotaxis protein